MEIIDSEITFQTPMDLYFAIAGIVACPILAIGWLKWNLWKEGEHRRKSPLGRNILRYPGYTLSRQIEEADDSLSFDFFLLFLIPALAMIVAMSPNLVGNAKWVLSGALYVSGVIFLFPRIRQSVRQIRSKRLGLKGELVVGFQLTELIRDGYYVFHDVPLDNENIDHVVVGPAGVFTIETKFRRKYLDKKPNYKVNYDGKVLDFAGNIESEPIEQAIRQRDKLLKILRPEYDIVSAIPFLIIPGWWITVTVPNPEVRVLSDLVVSKYIRDLPKKLEVAKVEEIAHLLDKKCRDVEM